LQLGSDELADRGFTGSHEADERNVLNLARVAHRIELTDLAGVGTQFLKRKHPTSRFELPTPNGLNGKVEGVDRGVLKAAPAFDEVGEGEALDNFDDSFADFFHDTADGAAGFVRARAFFVEPFADATDRRQRAFDVTDDDGEGDFLGPAGEA